MNFLLASQIDNIKKQKKFYIDKYEAEKNPQVKKIANKFCDKIYQTYGEIQDDIFIEKIIKYSDKYGFSQNEINNLFGVFFLNYSNGKIENLFGKIDNYNNTFSYLYQKEQLENKSKYSNFDALNIVKEELKYLDQEKFKNILHVFKIPYFIDKTTNKIISINNIDIPQEDKDNHSKISHCILLYPERLPELLKKINNLNYDAYDIAKKEVQTEDPHIIQKLLKVFGIPFSIEKSSNKIFPMDYDSWTKIYLEGNNYGFSQEFKKAILNNKLLLRYIEGVISSCLDDEKMLKKKKNDIVILMDETIDL
jgi:hypothetical protein